MQRLFGYDNWLTTPPEPRNPMCTCGHKWEEHLYNKVPDGGGGRIENDDKKCYFWESCGCEEFIETEGGDE